jgi:hypothetical protein
LAASQDPGFQPLFDGRTLNGWRIERGPETAFFVDQGDVVIHPGSNFPTWLRSERAYANFELRGEVFIQGWANSGLYLRAPLHGPPTECGLKINIFQKPDDPPLPVSMGAIFPVLAPRKVNVKNRDWNRFRVRLEDSHLQLWINSELVQDCQLDLIPALRDRLRSGYIGLESLSYPVRFRNFAIRELPSRDPWTRLYSQPLDLDAHWQPNHPEWIEKSKWEALGEVLRGDGLGYLATRESYSNFQLQMYVRASQHSNGGVCFRGSPRSPEHYEIQIHDVEGAVYPTGSIYGIERAVYPAIEPEQWYLFQLLVQDALCRVRINGRTAAESRGLKNRGSGPILLQAHQNGKWIEYKDVRVMKFS